MALDYKQRIQWLEEDIAHYEARIARHEATKPGPSFHRDFLTSVLRDKKEELYLAKATFQGLPWWKRLVSR